jgi:hypothetical protein
MGFLKGAAYFFGISYGLFSLIILIAIVVAISLGIKYILEQRTSLNKESITAITVFSGILAFFVLAAPVFFGVGSGFLGGILDNIFGD